MGAGLKVCTAVRYSWRSVTGVVQFRDEMNIVWFGVLRRFTRTPFPVGRGIL